MKHKFLPRKVRIHNKGAEILFITKKIIRKVCFHMTFIGGIYKNDFFLTYEKHRHLFLLYVRKSS